jgi:hypothetical protein
MHSLTKKKLSHLLIFLNELPLIRTQEDNLTGLRTITKKALHMLSGQRQVSMQEAVHMVDNQELVICSDIFTYVSLAQGQTLQYENDKSSSKDLITIYRNQDKKHCHYFLELYFYSPNKNWKKLKREKYMTEKSYFQK